MKIIIIQFKKSNIILKYKKYTLIPLESTSPNLLKNTKEYVELLKNKNQNKKKIEKEFHLIENNEYYFIDNIKNSKKINYGPSSNLNNVVKEKFYMIYYQ